MGAEVRMALDEYNAVIQARDAAQMRIAELEAQLAEAQLADPSGEVPALVDAIKAALPIIQFAVGNLDPTTIRGWPYDALNRFAEVLGTMPGVDATTKEYALEFRNFCLESRRIERERRERDLRVLTAD